VIGHKGAAGLYPENTLYGFERALDMDVDGIITNRLDRAKRLMNQA